ncbi:RAD55 family ATPase [Massilia sp. TWR1-2-2]|uniref:RAD55 family ATPase n=1 Tax=Massilia sp. TWR1-2-2 TaxID=2804584 RepID=UPI003CF110AE
MSEKLKVKLLKTGVPGLDEILGAGLPELSFNIIGGAPGSGKTTFAHQIMFSLATPTSKALFFTAMGEPPVKMLRYQQQFEFFDFDKVDGSIEFINLAEEVEQGNFDLVLAQILDAVRTHAPAYVFIDSFRSFIQGAKGEHCEIQALQSFVQQLVTQMTGWHATTFLIGKYVANEADQNPIFTVADGIIWLNQVVQRNAMVRKVQVIKMRGQRQRPGMHTFRISNVGIEIFPRMLAAADTIGAG